jgi:mannan endo-1,4-beta-mannosidase
MLMITLALAALLAPASKTIHLEAEDAQRVGNPVLTARPGYSGTGYVGSFQNSGDQVSFTIPDARAGIYSVRLRYSAPSGDKGYDLAVNGVRSSGMLPKTGDAFGTFDGGKVELREGANTVVIERGWGYYDIDYLELVPAPVSPPLQRPPLGTSDPRATDRTRALLASLVKRYGADTLSGQYDAADIDYIRSVTGKAPAIFGGDLIEYSPSRLEHGADPKGLTERMIQAAKDGQIVTVLWHWNAPSGLLDKTFTNAQGKTIDARWYRGFYTEATTFDLAAALDNPNSEEYRLIIRDIDAIAVQLKKLADADVPVLWRPLHEAEGGWFWWGAKGPEPFKKLWRLMFDRLTGTHHLHNLIWVYSSGTKPEWYPGDAYVDIVGVDAYPSDAADAESSLWETLVKQYGGRKLLALTEFGGVPDVDRMRRFGVRWSYFVSWTGRLGPRKMTRETLQRIYGSPAVITQDELGPEARGR